MYYSKITYNVRHINVCTMYDINYTTYNIQFTLYDVQRTDVHCMTYDVQTYSVRRTTLQTYIVRRTICGVKRELYFKILKLLKHNINAN